MTCRHGLQCDIGANPQLATLPEHPESVPINALVAVAGTPLEGSPPVEALDLVRLPC